MNLTKSQDLKTVMANKQIKFKGVKEEKFTSISKYNAANSTNYYLFDPKNITGFKCMKGKLGDNLAYLFEFIQCMWGNDEIYEYVILDDSLKAQLDLSQFGDIQSVDISNVKINYVFKKGLFQRYLYNAVFEIKNTTYYLYVKTIDGNRFFNLLKEFIESPLNN